MKNNFTFLNVIMVLTILSNFNKCIAQNTFPTSGNVGIGTVSPNNPLHIVSSNSHHQLRLQGISGKHSWLQFYPDGDDLRNWQIGVNESGFSIYDLSNAKYKFTISNLGNVGVRTSNPQDDFHIVGNQPSIRLSSQSYYGGSGNAKNSIISSVKFVNSDANENYRSEIRGVLTGGWATDVGLSFTTYSGGIQKERLRISHSGNVGINTDSPDEALTVKGKIHTQEVRVDLDGAVAPDYVFEKDYKLLELREVKRFVQQEGHLPNIPSAAKMNKDGLNLKEMNLKLLEKIEELTLYIFEQNDEIEKLKTSYKNLEKIIN